MLTGSEQTPEEAPQPEIPAADTPAPYDAGPAMGYLYRRFFQHMQVDQRWSDAVERADRSGVVVYVGGSISILDFVCLDYLTKRFGLPILRFANDLGLGILEPFGRGERRLRLRPTAPEEEALREVVSGGHSALLFLRKPPSFGRRARRDDALDADLIRTLVETQRKMDRSIVLVPQVFVWSKLPAAHEPSLLDLLFGPVEYPGYLRRAAQFVVNYRNAALRSGEPIDLAAFLESHPELDDEAVADKVRYALLRRIERERSLVLGPTKKTVGRLNEELLRSPRVRQHIDAARAEAKGDPDKVDARARKIMNRLAARQTPYMIRALYHFLSWVWTRIYDGIVVDAEGIERLREASRDGAVIYLPSHKSHIDYLVLSYVLYDNALPPPLIAAGDNLNFFPIGAALRRGGAFFIKRSFRGDPLYGALVDAYMRKLLVEGHGIEFFLEGGRSRTGKLLTPKYGLLSMVVDAATTIYTKKITFVPISIGYERIVEERSYVHELEGGDKTKENVGGLLKSSSVLSSRYGRLYVQFGEPIPFDEARREALESRGLAADAPLDAETKRVLTQRLAEQTMYRINEVTVVTPAALAASALLVNRRRGSRQRALRETCARLLKTLQEEGAHIASSLRRADGTLRPDTLDEALKLFLDARLVQKNQAGDETIFSVPSERRLGLEYYKNNIVHFFVPRAFVSAALLVGSRRTVSRRTLSARVEELARAFHHEFTFQPEQGFGAELDATLEAMSARGEIVIQGDRVMQSQGRDGTLVPMYAAMLTPYIEGYLLALRGGSMLADEERALSKKEWIKQTLTEGQRMYLSGELVLRESLSKHKLETAIKAMRDHDLMALDDEGNLIPGPSGQTRDAWAQYERRLSAFLRE